MRFKVEKLVISTQQKELVNITFEIENSFALVGQSGSGKSLTLKALLGMLPSNLHCTLEVDAAFSLERGKDISIVPQNPFTALSPLTKIEKQFMLAREKANNYMKMVDLDSSLLDRYPSELSGGQLQRVIIAMALSTNPKLLLLDEPTTALDSKTKEGILVLIKTLQEKVGYKILFVTHDVEATRMLCDQIAILKEGTIIESGSVDAVLINPKESYTQALIASNFKHRKKRV
ncbi:MAG: ATP-binding cassette domain-containing protein [Epsilonproteobacteria bacterium]|nr:ATP-binding cassette domain-containing protein [Campylobacterota bacterium]